VNFMKNAVRFERDTNRLLVGYRLSLDGVDGIELQTVLEAMDVSQSQCFYICIYG
jgi:centromere/kinetochore protein ZW10